MESAPEPVPEPSSQGWVAWQRACRRPFLPPLCFPESTSHALFRRPAGHQQQQQQRRDETPPSRACWDQLVRCHMGGRDLPFG
eukprot:364758-Chlamydomonas_euryale.AAC.8